VFDGRYAVELVGFCVELRQERDFLTEGVARCIPVQRRVTNSQEFVEIVFNDEMAGQKIAKHFVVKVFNPLPSYRIANNFRDKWR